MEAKGQLTYRWIWGGGGVVGTFPSPFPKPHAQVKSLRVLVMPTHSIFDALYPYHLQSGFSQNEDPVETNLYWS